MCTFDAPILPCECCGEYVVRDQTCAQCATEHECGDRECPLRPCFAAATEQDGDGIQV